MESLFVVHVEQDGLRCDLRGHVLKAGVHDGITYPCDHLVVTYTLENQAAVPCYVCNRGHANARSTLGYVEQRPAGVVELSQKAFLPPPDCPPTYVPVLPRVSVLKPGERQTESVYFELPLKAHTPFDFCFSESEMAPLTGSQMEFRLGYLRADEAGGRMACRCRHRYGKTTRCRRRCPGGSVFVERGTGASAWGGAPGCTIVGASTKSSFASRRCQRTSLDGTHMARQSPVRMKLAQ